MPKEITAESAEEVKETPLKVAEPVESTTPPVGEGTVEPLSGDEPGSQTAFSHATIVGKSPEEVQTYVQLLERTVGSQRTALTDANRRGETVVQETEKETDFFDNPRKAVEEIITEQLSDLKTFVKGLKGSDTRAALRVKYPDFAHYESYINQLLEQGQFPNPDDEGLLETLYYTAVGIVSKQAAVPAPAPAPERDVIPVTRAVSPQHRPSPAPVPSSAPAAVTLRELTEDEETLRKEWGMSKEAYLREQEMNPEDVATFKAGGE